MTETLASPFPYFGGKGRAATAIWHELGDPGRYIEPFAGSAAVLLARPAVTGARAETLNDADGWLVNFWRAIKHSPADVARHALGPVAELDLHARHAWLQARRDDGLTAWLAGHPDHHDAKAAGWWLYVMCCALGAPFRGGPWHSVDGHLTRTDNTPAGITCSIPAISATRGIHRDLSAYSDDPEQAVLTYMRHLSARLQRVQIMCGSWERVLTPAARTLRRGGDGSHAIFLDPPYATSGDLYVASTSGVAEAVRAWCLKAPPQYRIVLCGYEDEHDELLDAGWRKRDGQSGSGNGYSKAPAAGRRERLWCSPATLGQFAQEGLWDES